VFLRVFSIRRQGLSLLGEVDRVTPVDNQRGRGAAIAGFRAELFESRIELCRDCNTLGVCHSLSSGFELKHDRLSGGEPNLNLDVTPLLCI
jgi:hypothetical protein